LANARSRGVRGAGVTPMLLAEVERETDGESIAANLALLERNAAVAADIAIAARDVLEESIELGGVRMVQ
jgi:pseudouridine-5'-phosphate glycosidase